MSPAYLEPDLFRCATHTRLCSTGLRCFLFCTLSFLALEGQISETRSQGSSRMEKPTPEPGARQGLVVCSRLSKYLWVPQLLYGTAYAKREPDVICTRGALLWTRSSTLPVQPPLCRSYGILVLPCVRLTPPLPSALSWAIFIRHSAKMFLGGSEETTMDPWS